RSLLSSSSLVDVAGIYLPGDDTAGNSPDYEKIATTVVTGFAKAIFGGGGGHRDPEAAGPVDEQEPEDDENAPADEPTQVVGSFLTDRAFVFSQAVGDDKYAFFDDIYQGQRD